MQTANEYLSKILGVVSQIENNQRKSESSQKAAGSSSGGIGALSGNLAGIVNPFNKVKKKAVENFFSFLKGFTDIAENTTDGNVKRIKLMSESLTGLSHSMPGLATGLSKLGGLRALNVRMGVNSLSLLFNSMEEMGEGRRVNKVKRAIKTFDSMGKALNKVAKPIRSIANTLTFFGLGIVAFAGSLMVAGAILGTGSGWAAVGAVVGMIVAFTGVFYLLSLADKAVNKGSAVAKGMGMGMAVLSLGIISFAITLKILPLILGGESSGSIAKSMLIIAGIVVASAGMFWLMGKLAGPIAQGVAVAGGMALGMLFLSGGVIALATASRALMGGGIGLGPSDASVKEKDDDKSRVVGGLGMMGIIVLAATAMFAGLAFASPVVVPGIAVSIGMSIALIALAYSTVKLVEASKKLEGTDVAKTVGSLISSTIDGFLDGISSLSGKGGNFLTRAGNFIKNSGKVFAGVAVLTSMSIALSMFAKGISAFAELDNMRIIKGHDDKGNPIFGEKINIKNVSNNITFSISTFLSSLIASTEGLTYSKAFALKKMSRALTGKRGMLSAVIQFTDVLKAYAEFGDKGEIGYLEMYDTGKTDEDGNPIMGKRSSKVGINTVANNIANSFTTFVGTLLSKTSQFELSGSQGKKMMRLATVLMGTGPYEVFGLNFGRKKPGLLEPITKFSETLVQFAKMPDGKLPILGKDGTPTGEYIAMGEVAGNIVKALTDFTSQLGSKKIEDDTDQAENNIGVFSDLMEQLNDMTKEMDGLDRFNLTIKDMASNIGSLSENLAKLNVEKLNSISDIGSVYLKRTDSYKNSNERIQQASYTSPSASTSNTVHVQDQRQQAPVHAAPVAQAKVDQPDWNLIAAQIGEAVGSQLANAMKSGQMKFEFSSTGGNRGIIEFN